MPEARAALLFSVALFAQANERVAVRQRVGSRRPARRSPASAPTRSRSAKTAPARSAARHAGDLADAGRDPRRQLAGGAQSHRRHPPRADLVRARRSTASARSSIIGVADRPTILRDYTTDQKQLDDGVGKVFAMPGSGATLLDAIVEISKGLQKREEDRAAMVILTTENIEFSTRHYNDVLEALAKGGAHAARRGPQHAGRHVARRCGAQPRLGARSRPARKRRHAHRRARQPGVRGEAAGAGRDPEEPASRGLCAAADADSAAEDRSRVGEGRASKPAAARRADRRSDRCDARSRSLRSRSLVLVARRWRDRVAPRQAAPAPRHRRHLRHREAAGVSRRRRGRVAERDGHRHAGPLRHRSRRRTISRCSRTARSRS